MSAASPLYPPTFTVKADIATGIDPGHRQCGFPHTVAPSMLSSLSFGVPISHGGSKRAAITPRLGAVKIAPHCPAIMFIVVVVRTR